MKDVGTPDAKLGEDLDIAVTGIIQLRSGWYDDDMAILASRELGELS